MAWRARFASPASIASTIAPCWATLATDPVEDGALWLHRPDRPPGRLKAMTGDGLFQAVDNDTLRVRITPRVLDLLRPDPAWSVQYRK